MLLSVLIFRTLSSSLTVINDLTRKNAGRGSGEVMGCPVMDDNS